MRALLLASLLLVAGCAAPVDPEADASRAPRFLPPVAVDPAAPASEPRLVVGPDGTLWLSAMPGNRPDTLFGIPHVSGLWSSRDGGRSWTRVPWAQEVSGLGPGGGDSDVAAGPDGTLLVVDAWGGADAAGVSRDGGRTWTRAAATGETPLHDRPWAAVDGEGRAYVLARILVPGVVAWVARSDDGGASWRTVGRAWTEDEARSPLSSNLVVDGDALRTAYACRADAFCLASSTDAGATWREEPVARLSAPPSSAFPALAADGAGGLHLAWTQKDAGSHAVWLASKEADGAWGAPRQVSPPGGNHLLPWVAARHGHAALAWYATDAEGDPNDSADMAGARWRVVAARCAPACRLADAALDVHEGTVNTLGVAGDARAQPADWTLGDFLSVALDVEGRMHVAYATGTEDAPRAMHLREA